MCKKRVPLVLSFLLPVVAVMLLIGGLRSAAVKAATNATVTVMNTNDSGAGSLRDAINTAVSGDSINFDAALSGKTITLTTELVVNKNVSISGNVPITISGDNNTRVFSINGAEVTLDSLTIYHGRVAEGYGGGIEATSSVLTLTNSVVLSNTAFSGGGIASFGGALSITNSHIDENVASLADDFGGGGILALDNSSLLLVDTFVQNNRSSFDGGGMVLADVGATSIINTVVSDNDSTDSGGGLYVYNSPITITNSAVTSNTAVLDGAGLWGLGTTHIVINGGLFGNNRVAGKGGAIYYGVPSGLPPQPPQLNAMAVQPPALALTNVDIISNTAVNDSGGGIFADTGTTVSLEGGTLERNQANNAPGGSIAYGRNNATLAANATVTDGFSAESWSSFTNRSEKVGVTAALSSTLMLTNVNVISGTAVIGGGISGLDVTVIVHNSTFTGNSGYLAGGGIETSLGVLQISDSVFTGNGDGNFGGGVAANASVVTITNSIFSDGRSAYGGGVYAQIDSSVTILNSVIEGNRARFSGGGVYVINDSRLYIGETAVVNNNAETERGGGIYIRSGVNAQLINSTISGNQALAMNGTVNDAGNGGGIYVGAISPEPFNIITVTHSSIINNHAGGEGGGMDFNRGAPGDILTFRNSIMAGNTADGASQNCYDYGTANYTFNSNAYNIFSGAVGDDCPVGTTDISLVTLGLTITDVVASLADNGGNTWTHALVAGSPALDTDNSNCTTLDQRGIARPQNGMCDSGAFEAQVYELTVGIIGGGTVSNTTGIDCGVDCAEIYMEGTAVTLTATPDINYSFAGWSGDCSGTGGCTVTMDAAMQVTATFTLNIITYTTFLPIIMTPAGEPDLIVEAINVTADSLEVVIKNVGTGVTDSSPWDGFWVDLYINPLVAPTMNQTWKTIGGEGLVWGVTTPLQPSESFTLTLNGLYYDASESYFTGTITAGSTLYAQVDAIGDPAFGAVLETDENNNIMGPFVVPNESTPANVLGNGFFTFGLMAKRP